MYRRLHRKPSQSQLLDSHVSQLVILHGSPEAAINAIESTMSHMPTTQDRLVKALRKVITLRDEGGSK